MRIWSDKSMLTNQLTNWPEGVGPTHCLTVISLLMLAGGTFWLVDHSLSIKLMFYNKWDIPDKVGSVKGQLNGCVDPLVAGECCVSLMTLSACRFSELTRSGQPIVACVHMAWRKLIGKADWLRSGSSLIVVVELGELARPERTYCCEEELMKTFGNWSSTVVWLC